jgi:hypothetical protein
MKPGRASFAPPRGFSRVFNFFLARKEFLPKKI